MTTSLKIDHVTLAGPSLAPMQEAFAALGLETDYGGPHSNNVTHMALLGLPDGSYIELISTLEPGNTAHKFWPEHIAGGAGPCAWAVQVDDVAAEAARVAGLGVPVEGPAAYHRQRPDGLRVEWDLAFLGGGAPGATLPFIIKDRTPRDYRVRPSVSALAMGVLAGVETVVLGVPELEAAAALFRRVYGWDAPLVAEDATFGARLACFQAAPVTLAAPLRKGGWLAKRLARFGPAPCAYLLGASDFAAACARFGLEEPADWFGRRAAWLDPARLNGARLGLLGPTPASRPARR